MIYYHEVDRVEDPAEGYVDYEVGSRVRQFTPMSRRICPLYLLMRSAF